MDFLRNLSESLAVLGQVAPSSQAASESLSAAINCKQHRRLLAVVQIGALGGSATVDVVFKASATSGGSYVAVTGALLAQHTTGNNKVLLLELKTETLASLGVGPFVKLSVTVGTAATLTSAVVFGSCDRYEPASDYNDAIVTQTVVA